MKNKTECKGPHEPCNGLSHTHTGNKYEVKKVLVLWKQIMKYITNIFAVTYSFTH